jgi:hypothetical protein
MIGMNCATCQTAPKAKESFGCESPLQVPAVYFGDIEDEEWYNCPMRFITQSSYDFLNEYDAYKSGMAEPMKYGKQSAKYFEAVRTFDHYLSMFSNMKQGK